MTNKVYDAKLSTPTLSVMRQATALLFGLPISYPQYSTLNEALKFLTDRVPATTERPVCTYLAIGNQGHTVVTEDDGFTDFDAKGKTAIISGLCNQMPFVLRTKDNDLSDEQRKNYRHRIELTVNGVVYWAYYVKKISLTGATQHDYDIKRVNGVDTVTEFVYTDAELHPVITDLPDYNYDTTSSTVTVPDGRYVLSVATVDIPFTEFDVAEYQNVCSIIRGNPARSVMSEFALATGVETVASGQSATGSSFSYAEVVGLTVAYHITMYKNVAQENGGFTLRVRVGQSAPRYVGPV